MLWVFSMCWRSFPFCEYLEGHRAQAKCFWPPHSNLTCFIRLYFVWYDLPQRWQANTGSLLSDSCTSRRDAVADGESAKEKCSISIERCNPDFSRNNINQVEVSSSANQLPISFPSKVKEEGGRLSVHDRLWKVYYDLCVCYISLLERNFWNNSLNISLCNWYFSFQDSRDLFILRFSNSCRQLNIYKFDITSNTRAFNITAHFGINST